MNSIEDIIETIQDEEFDGTQIIQQNIQFIFQSVTFDYVKEICKNFNNKNDTNFMNKTILLDNFELLGPGLVNIINASLNGGIVPETWKQSLVVPVEKVKNSRKIKEFRPINMLPLSEKY